STNLSTIPSESHVISHSVANSVGFLLSLCIGTIGNSCSSAQLSGIERKTEKLARYFAHIRRRRSSNSSETYFFCWAYWSAASQMSQKSTSPLPLSSSDIRPRLNIVKSSSRCSSES